MGEAITITTDEANLMRQWFGAVQDVNPAFLAAQDYELAQRLYQALGMRVPNSISAGTLKAGE